MTTANRMLDYGALRDRLTKGRSALQPRLRQDLIERAKQPAVAKLLRARWEQEKADKLTADAIGAWTERLSAQIASAWILTTLFVRVLEDRGFLRRKRLFGPEAEEAREAMIRLAPRTGARDYLLLVFQELQEFPAAKPLFDAAHNLAWRLSPSAELADALLAFWGEKVDGGPVFPFGREATEGTVFLGDLYQDLDAQVRERYALLQTPPFVADFILDRTLTPALETFGLGDPSAPTRMIDPTCGSGHFLLLGFERLLKAWRREAPGAGKKAHVERALRGVYGVDLNPYAVAIARFRLTLAALEALGIESLDVAPELSLNLLVTDSLLLGDQHQLHFRGSDGRSFAGTSIFDLEDPEKALRTLGQAYHAVVGNPPYIAPKNKARAALYRKRYEAAAGKFALSAPFVERFFSLALAEGEIGFVGLIVANSFMKRDFGQALIKRVLSKRDLHLIVDSQGAYIPGHGTPTIILFGRNREPSTSALRAVLGRRAEPRVPSEPANGHVWKAIARHAEDDYEDEFVSCINLDRRRLERHPWCLVGGGAIELSDTLRKASTETVAERATFGVFGRTSANDVFFAPGDLFRRQRIENKHWLPLVDGEDVRDWVAARGELATLFPYEWPQNLVDETAAPRLFRWLWRWRTYLGLRATSGEGGNYFADNLPWWRWHRVTEELVDDRLAITFSEISTHNHFALVTRRLAYNQTSPLLKTPSGEKVDALNLLSILTSSLALFWFRLECHSKGGGGIGGGIASEPWEQFLVLSGRNVLEFPLVNREREQRILLAQALTEASESLQGLAPRRTISDAPKDTDYLGLSRILGELREARSSTLARMIALQEELDWLVYRAYGLVSAESCPVLEPNQIPSTGLELGHRPFEIALQRRSAAGLVDTAWFQRHGSEPVSEVPSSYPTEYREILKARLRLIEEQPRSIGLIEQPEKKRRWSQASWDGVIQSSAKRWLLDEIESDFSEHSTAAWGLRDIAEALRKEPRRQAALEIAFGQGTQPSFETAAELVERDAVPGVSRLVYKPSGMTKHLLWREVWDLQRREDAGELVPLPKPPTFSVSDFMSTYWSCRGKLDVPKERFVLIPEASDEDTPGPIFLWAGWDQLAQARQIAAVLSQRLNAIESDHQDQARRLVPLFCALDELIFWVRLWWPDPDPDFGNVWAETFEEFIRSKLPKLGLPEFQKREDLAAWRPTKTKGRGRRDSKPNAKKEPPERGAVEQALEELGGEAKTADLAKALGVTQKLLKSATKPLEGDVFEVVKRRPLTYRLASAKAVGERETK